MASSIVVRASWDRDARVWVAESEDVPGLATEAASLEDLQQKLQVMIPELLEANEVELGDGVTEVPLFVVAEHLSKVRTRSAA